MPKVIKLIKFNHKMQISKFSEYKVWQHLKLSKLTGCEMNKNNSLFWQILFLLVLLYNLVGAMSKLKGKIRGLT